MTADAARVRADGRRILSVKGRGAAIKMKIRAAFEQPDTAIPAENAVVVADGADFFRFGEATHGFFDEREKDVRGIADDELGFCAAFVQQARVVETFVRVAQALEEREHLRIPVAGGAEELIGDGEAEHAEG